MKPQKAFQTSLTAIMIAALMLAPFSSSEAESKTKRNSFNIHLQVVDEGASKQDRQIDLTIPNASGKDKGKEKGNDNNKQQDHEQGKMKHHSEEEKHKNHLYHYHRVKTKKKCHTSLLCFSLKIFLAVSYISVLLCGFMSICH